MALDETARCAWVADACDGDEALRDEVLSLLRSHDEAGTAFDAQLQAVPAVLDASPGDAEPEPMPESLGPWRLLRPLGRGGMGSVFLAARGDEAYRQHVAVKLLHGGAPGPEAGRRFCTERQILADLVHPGIARLLDGGTADDGRPYLVMEHVDGLPIDRFCDERRLPITARLALFARVCSIVHFAHQRLVIHRDLKPANVLVTPEGAPKLLDFGIAKLLTDAEAAPSETATLTGRLPMTPEYASPEQVRGEPVTTACDVYALGVMLYELLCGHRPHQVDRRAPAELARIVCEEQPERPSTRIRRRVERPLSDGTSPVVAPTELALRRGTEVSRASRALRGDLDTIVLMALRKDPLRRYASAEQLAEDLERHASGLPVRARPDSLGYRAQKFVRRNRAAVAAAASGLALLLSFTLTLLVQWRETLRQRQRAELVSEFLVDVFALPDPTRALGERVTARQLLDRGASRIRSELTATPELQSDLLHTMGLSYANLGLYDESRQLLEGSLVLRREHTIDEPERIASTLQGLADVAGRDGDYRRAERLAREALELRRRARRGEDDAGVAESLLRVARALGQQGAPAAAESQFREALALARGLGDPATLAKALDGYAMLLHELDRSREAEPLFREALELQQRLHGDRHPEIALTLNNLALSVQRRDYDAAEALFRRAEAMQRRLFDGPHPQLATTLNNLGLLLQRRGRLEAAEVRYADALTLQRAAYQGDHPRVGATLANLASLRLAQGRYAEAEAGFREAAALQVRTLGERHADTANTLNSLAQVLATVSRHDEAGELYHRALEITRERLGPRHHRVAAILNNLADLAQTRGDLDEAEALYEQAVAGLRAALGEGHIDVAVALHNLASLRRDRGDLRGAEAGFREAAEIARRRLGTEHTTVAVMACSLAALLNQRGADDEAEAVVRPARRTLRRALPGDDPAVVAADRVLAGILVGRGRFADAEPLLLAALEAAQSDEGTERARSALVDLYRAWGRPERADGLRGDAARPDRESE